MGFLKMQIAHPVKIAKIANRAALAVFFIFK